jgi:hypothetical protein
MDTKTDDKTPRPEAFAGFPGIYLGAVVVCAAPQLHAFASRYNDQIVTIYDGNLNNVALLTLTQPVTAHVWRPASPTLLRLLADLTEAHSTLRRLVAGEATAADVRAVLP